jgi:shikimate kinase
MATLWLVGMMGSGKTTVGRLVADRLDVPFLDTDDEVVRATGRTIPELFAEGEAAFREAEAEAVRSVAASDAVVACGGGVVLDDASVAVLRATGLVVWLDAPVAVLSVRVAGGEERPLLDDDSAERLEHLASERRERYERAAHCRVDAGHHEPADTAEEVIAAWTSWS